MSNNYSEVRNFTKVRALLFLQRKAIEARDDLFDSLASVIDIAAWTGCKQSSLYVLLERWVSWGYVEVFRFPAMAMRDGHAHNFYKITPKGISYLQRLGK